MVRRLYSSSRAVFLIIGLLSAAIAIFSYWIKPRFIAFMDMKATDAMFAARGAIKPVQDVVIVAVDEKSVNELGRWPWQRSTTARLIDSLREARTVALDMVFSEKTDSRSDNALALSIKKSGNVISGFFFRDDSGEVPSQAALEQMKRSSIGLVSSSAEAAPFPGVEFASVEPNIETIGEGASGYGAFNVFPEEDGAYRKAHLLFLYGGEIYPALSLDALRHYLGSEVIVNLAPYGIDSLSIGERLIPVDEAGAFTLNFYGPGGSFRTYSASDVIAGRVSPGEFRDKLVFVGVTEKAVYDIRPAPVDSLFPGVEMHATVASNVLSGGYLVHDGRVVAFDLLMTALLPLVLCMVLAKVRNIFVSLGAFLFLLAAIIALDFYLFAFYSIRAGAVYPSLSLFTAYLSGEAYRNFVVEKRSRYLKKAFSAYVSSQLVSEILKDPGRLKLGGERRNITVLFSDIRGFTTLSEGMEPEGLVRLLNEYLNPMTVIVQEEEGMLDKYIGDAIMAVFNAPLPIRDHSLRACKAALRMMEKLKDLNEGWKKAGYSTLDIGIGINTGDAVVGNMGAELRFDYTAIGDTVNLASRLEGMNKTYGTSVLVTESTYENVKEAFDLREVDLVRVKGKARPVVIYELVGRKGEGPYGLMSRFSEGLSLYRAGRFREAREVFEGLATDTGDRVSALYASRCAAFVLEPPPSGWDGVYSAKTK